MDLGQLVGGTFLVLNDVERVPAEPAEVMRVEDDRDRTWLLYNCGRRFTHEAKPGDIMTLCDCIVLCVGQEWTAPSYQELQDEHAARAALENR